MSEEQELADIQARLFKSLREGCDLAPEKPSEVEALLTMMAKKDISLGTDAENAAALVAKALASNSKCELPDFGDAVEETEVETELARAARGGKQKIPKEIEERMRKDREAAENENDKTKA